jgi:hypothetical protein
MKKFNLTRYLYEYYQKFILVVCCFYQNLKKMTRDFDVGAQGATHGQIVNTKLTNRKARYIVVAMSFIMDFKAEGRKSDTQ